MWYYFRAWSKRSIVLGWDSVEVPPLPDVIAGKRKPLCYEEQSVGCLTAHSQHNCHQIYKQTCSSLAADGGSCSLSYRCRMELKSSHIDTLWLEDVRGRRSHSAFGQIMADHFSESTYLSLYVSWARPQSPSTIDCIAVGNIAPSFHSTTAQTHHQNVQSSCAPSRRAGSTTQADVFATADDEGKTTFARPGQPCRGLATVRTC